MQVNSTSTLLPGKPPSKPQAFEKMIITNAWPSRQFWLANACLVPCSYCEGQMWLIVAINKHNPYCFSSIELDNIGQRHSKWFYCFRRSQNYSAVTKCSAYSKMMMFESFVFPEHRWKWWQDVTRQVFCCLQIPGDWDTITVAAKCPPSRTHQLQIPRLCPGGDAYDRNWLTH